MTSDGTRLFLDRFVHAWERQDVKTLAECYAPDCVVSSPIFQTLHGRAQLERSYTDLFKAFAHQKVRVDDIIIGDEDPVRAVIVWTVESTHVGEIFGMAASGKRIERTLAYILTLRDGLIVKEVRMYDFTQMLLQLGVLRTRPGKPVSEPESH
jgi:steroid delta-isomerase-like uncharacterized protein